MDQKELVAQLQSCWRGVVLFFGDGFAGAEAHSHEMTRGPQLQSRWGRMECGESMDHKKLVAQLQSCWGGVGLFFGDGFAGAEAHSHEMTRGPQLQSRWGSTECGESMDQKELVAQLQSCWRGVVLFFGDGFASAEAHSHEMTRGPQLQSRWGRMECGESMDHKELVAQLQSCWGGVVGVCGAIFGGWLRGLMCRRVRFRGGRCDL